MFGRSKVPMLHLKAIIDIRYYFLYYIQTFHTMNQPVQSNPLFFFLGIRVNDM